MNYSRLISRLTRYFGISKEEALRHGEDLENAFANICNLIRAHADVPRILWEINKNCFYCLRADRATTFILDTTKQDLQHHTKFTYCTDPSREKVRLKEEEEIARRSFERNKPLALGEKEVAELFPESRDQGWLSSAMAFPFASRGKLVGVITVMVIDRRRGFGQENLRLLSAFGHLASIALEMADLLRELHQEAVWRRDFEKSLDNILIHLPALFAWPFPRPGRSLLTSVILPEREDKK